MHSCRSHGTPSHQGYHSQHERVSKEGWGSNASRHWFVVCTSNRLCWTCAGVFPDQAAKDVVLSEKPVIMDDSSALDPLLLDKLLGQVGAGVGGTGGLGGQFRWGLFCMGLCSYVSANRPLTLVRPGRQLAEDILAHPCRHPAEICLCGSPRLHLCCLLCHTDSMEKSLVALSLPPCTDGHPGIHLPQACRLVRHPPAPGCHQGRRAQGGGSASVARCTLLAALQLSSCLHTASHRQCSVFVTLWFGS